MTLGAVRGEERKEIVTFENEFLKASHHRRWSLAVHALGSRARYSISDGGTGGCGNAAWGLLGALGGRIKVLHCNVCISTIVRCLQGCAARKDPRIQNSAFSLRASGSHVSSCSPFASGDGRSKHWRCSSISSLRCGKKMQRSTTRRTSHGAAT